MTTIQLSRGLTALVATALVGTLAGQDTPSATPPQADGADVPRVLIVGDSISMGYTEPVVELLKGIAHVERVRGNCGDTKAGLANLTSRWLGDTKWGVIHFNWGLHDLCYRNPASTNPAHRDKVGGTQAVPLADYEKNLGTLVGELKATGATLVWASTTVVPDGDDGRFAGDEVKYNAVAAKVMARHGVMIDDLHALSKSFEGKHSKPGNVHYDEAGSKELAAQVAESIKAALARRASAK